MATPSATTSFPLYEEIGKFCLTNEIEDDDVIIRTCSMDDVTLHGIPANPNARWLNLARKAFRDLGTIDEQNCSVEDAELLSRYGFDDGIMKERKPLIQRHFLCFADELRARIANKFMLGLTLFVTDQGRLGMGPSYMAVGDLIAVIIGYAAPVALRSVEHGRYSMIGEVYLDGVMYGEAVERELYVECFEIV